MSTAQAPSEPVTTGIPGVLQQLPVEIGQRVTPGTNLARVADPTRVDVEPAIVLRTHGSRVEEVIELDRDAPAMRPSACFSSSCTSPFTTPRLLRVDVLNPFLVRTPDPPVSAVEGRRVTGLRRLGNGGKRDSQGNGCNAKHQFRHRGISLAFVSGKRGGEFSSTAGTCQGAAQPRQW